MDQFSSQTNPNTADRDQLISLKGIGPALAERIIEKRPYQDFDQLLDVRGIGPSLLENLTPLLTLSAGHPDSPGEELPPPVDRASTPSSLPAATGEQTARTEDTDDSSAAASPLPSAQESPRKVFSRSQTIWLVALASLFSFILALALTLGLLSGLNNGLRYPSVSQHTRLQEELRGFSRELRLLEKEAADLRTRVDNLDSVLDRVETLEKDYTRISEDLSQMAAALEEVQGQTDTFQTFLENLRQNLNELLPSQE